MSEVTEYKPGTFCWPELVASDAGKAKEFYKSLFNWEIRDSPIGVDQVYSMAYIRDKKAGSIYQMLPEQSEHGMASYWASYVSVSNVEEAVERAKSLGASTFIEPMDVFDAGRMAAIQDPTWGIISLWQPLKHIGAEVVNEHGALCWNEYVTNDMKEAKEFYIELFGWAAQDMDYGGINYTVFLNSDRPAGGMMKIQEEWGDMPPTWFVYFAVNDCDAAVEKAKSLGGEALNAPMDIDGVGRIAYLKDSQGALFAIITLLQQPD